MRATTTTTIRGVSILSEGRGSHAEVFDIALSPTGIEIKWRGRPAAQMPWDRVSQWEIEERRGGVLLTLRGDGSTTPLVVPGWSPDDLEVLMRNTAGAVTMAPPPPAPAVPSPMERRRRSWTPEQPGPVVEARRDRRAAGPAGHRGDARAAPERRGDQLELPRPHRLKRPQAVRTPTKRSSSVTSVGPTRLWAKRNSSKGGSRASPRAGGRTRTASWDRPGSHVPSGRRPAPG